MNLRRLCVPLLCALPCGAPALAQVSYRLAFEPGGKEWRVEARFAGRNAPSLDLWFPLWTPGAYHVANYGRFVDGLEAADGQGHPLAVEREDDAHFVLADTAAAEEVVVRYRVRSASDDTLSNDLIDVEANRIRPTYAYVNPVSVFAFVAGRLDEPVTLAVALPDGWKVGTVLERDAEQRFLAPSYYRFEDSPLLFSPTLVTRTFQAAEKAHTVHLHGREADADALAAGCKRIVEASAELMQGLPYERYDFLLAFTPDSTMGASGLEHSFSTLMLMPLALPLEGVWPLAAHEYFHLWCAERIHVQGIDHPDYTRPFQTGTIWVNEGITEYMTQHVLLHAGFMERDELVAHLLGSPGGGPGGSSWTQVSRDFGAPNRPFRALAMPFMLKMYMQGPRTIFALDLAMRRASSGERGVLDLLRFLMWAYGRAGRGFGEDEMLPLIDGVAQADLGAFYRDYIDGEKDPDVRALLDVIGYRARGRHAEPLEDASAEQVRAREDFFAASGRPE